MATLKNYNGHYCESEFEYAFLSFLEDEGWHYLHGNSIPRENKTTVLYSDDMEKFLSKTNADLTADDIRQIMDRVRLAGAESEFSTLHMVYGWMVDGVQFVLKTESPVWLRSLTLSIPKTISSARSISLPLNISITGRRKPATLIFFSLSMEYRCAS